MFGIDLTGFNALGLPGMMALILLVQAFVTLKAIDLIKTHVVPLVSNHFKHVEDAFDRMAKQSDAHSLITVQQMEVAQNQTSVIKAQGVLLRTLLEEIESRTKE